MAEDFLTPLTGELLRCNRCGFCQDACPTYKVTGDERALARGRIRMLRLAFDGSHQFVRQPEMAAMISSCLLCKACVMACPSRVATDTMVLAARAAWHRQHGLPPVARYLYRGVFSHPGRLRLMHKGLRFYQKTGLRWLARKTGLTRIVPLAGRADAQLPTIPAGSVRDFLDRMAASGAATTLADGNVVLGQGDAPTVGYFLGCAVNHFFSPVGKATLQVLQAHQRRVVVPAVNCCGAPHQSAGDLTEAKRLARRVVDTLSAITVEAWVTDCATCGSTLQEYGKLLADDPVYAAKGEQLAAKVTDITAYLVSIGLKQPDRAVPVTVTYHDPCHLSRGMLQREAPRTVLRAIPGLILSEMKEADMCCGGAGSYGLTHPRLSNAILARKMANVRQSGAGVLVTSCPSCALQLGRGLRQSGLPLPVYHPVQLLAAAYGLIALEPAREVV